MYISIQKQLGINMLELIISTSIISILISLSASSFSSLLEKNRVISATNNIITALHLARNAAVSTNKNVHICRKNIDNSCDTNYSAYLDWSNGWLVFIDHNMNANYDKLDTIISVTRKTNHTKIIFNQRGRLRYFPSGFSRSAGFYICGKNKKHFRRIIMLYSGRARIKNNLTETEKSRCDS